MTHYWMFHKKKQARHDKYLTLSLHGPKELTIKYMYIAKILALAKYTILTYCHIVG